MLSTVKSTNEESLSSAPRQGHGSRLVIEFVGPTGSGKTTNCQYFADYFKAHGLRTFVFTDVKDYLFGLALYLRLKIYLQAIVAHRRKIFNYIMLLAKNGIYHVNSVTRYLRLCIFNSAVEEFLKKKDVDVLVLDQWSIQGLWSALIFRANNLDNLQHPLEEFLFPTSFLLYFDLDEETANNRIGMRKAGRSRFDSMNPEERLSLMKKYNHLLKYLFEKSPCRKKLVLSTRVDPVKNAEEFFNYMTFSQKTG